MNAISQKSLKTGRNVVIAVAIIGYILTAFLGSVGAM